MKKWILVSFIALFGSTLVVAAEAPSSAQSCVACHGKAGVSDSSEWPNLAGQHADYLAIQLKAFRDGARINLIMAPFVAKLSDSDIRELADYYAAQTPGTAADGDKALVAVGESLAGSCTACHGFNGTPVAGEWPILPGQPAQYLQAQLAAYKSGARMSPLMQVAIAHLGEDQFAALAAYYSHLPH